MAEVTFISPCSINHYTLPQVTKPGNTEIDLDLGVGGRGGMDQLAVEKPTLSNKAWKRLSGKHKGRIKTESGGSEMLEGDCLHWLRIVYCIVLSLTC